MVTKGGELLEPLGVDEWVTRMFLHSKAVNYRHYQHNSCHLSQGPRPWVKRVSEYRVLQEPLSAISVAAVSMTSMLWTYWLTVPLATAPQRAWFDKGFHSSHIFNLLTPASWNEFFFRSSRIPWRGKKNEHGSGMSRWVGIRLKSCKRVKYEITPLMLW